MDKLEYKSLSGYALREKFALLAICAPIVWAVGTIVHEWLHPYIPDAVNPWTPPTLLAVIINFITNPVAMAFTLAPLVTGVWLRRRPSSILALIAASVVMLIFAQIFLFCFGYGALF